MSATPSKPPTHPLPRPSSAPARLQQHPSTTSPSPHPHFTIPATTPRARLEAACTYLGVRYTARDPTHHLTLRLYTAVRALRPLPQHVYAAPQLSGFWRPQPGTIALLTRDAQRLIITGTVPVPARREPLHTLTDGVAPVTEDYLRMLIMLEEAEDAAGRTESEGEDEDGRPGARSMSVCAEEGGQELLGREAWRECGDVMPDAGEGAVGDMGRGRDRVAAEMVPEMCVLEVLRAFTDGEGQRGAADDAAAGMERADCGEYSQ